MNTVAGIGRFGIFLGRVAVATVTHRPPIEATLREAYTLGVRSLPVLLVISAFVGTNLAVQGYFAFAPLGGQSLVGMFVGLAGVREMAPIMVAALVAAKGGTEMASQLAVMRIREQIDALSVMAVDPYWFLITPRFAGILLVLPALTMISVFTVIGSSWLVVVAQLGLNGSEFLQQVAQTTQPSDLLACVVKSVIFGAVICTVSCFQGFHSDPGPSGVGRATNAAVVLSAVICAALNYVLSEVLFG